MIEKALEYIHHEIYKYGLEIISEKPINYGIQLLICDQNSSIGDSLPINIYYSSKKGHSIVIGGAAKSPVKHKLMKLAEKFKIQAYNNFTSNDGSLNNSSSKLEISYLHKWKDWIGTDESGKGDFFGPLVVAGFACNRKIASELLQMGVMDSKALKDKQIENITRYVYGKFKDRIETLVMNPDSYNKIYSRFRSEGKKLNELMAWMHSRIIINLNSRFKVEGAMIDKFTTDNKIKTSLKGMQQIAILQVPRAEQDIAVATASIIARYHFIKAMDTLSRKYQLKLLKGANSGVINTGKEFVSKYSVNDLQNVCKVHFKTYNLVIQNGHFNKD